MKNVSFFRLIRNRKEWLLTMKRIFALFLAVVMCFCTIAMTASCTSSKSDWEKISADGVFVVGCTIYEPMNYYEDDGVTLTGFDTELAEKVAELLGVKVNFQIIEWGNKYIELNTGKVDCLWNGFTSNCADDDGVQRSSKVDFSYAYLDNAQCVVMKSDNASSVSSAEDLASLSCAYEAGSAGATYATTVVTDENKRFPVSSQTAAFTELLSGKVDFIVVDVLLANEMCGQGDFTSLTKVTAVEIETEEYSIGFRTGSDFTAKVNEAILTLLKNGELEALANKYGVTVTASLLAMKETN